MVFAPVEATNLCDINLVSQNMYDPWCHEEILRYLQSQQV